MSHKRKEGQNSRGKRLAGILAVTLVMSMTSCAGKVERMPEKSEQTESAGTENLDKTAAADALIRPQDDFYGYCNKDYLKALPVSYRDESGVYEIEETVQGEIVSLLEDLAASTQDYAPGSKEQLVRDAYRQTLAYLETGEDGGRAHFEEIAGRIEDIKNLEELKALCRMLVQDEGIGIYFDATVLPNFYDGKSYALTLVQKGSFAGFEMKDIYTKDDTRQELRRYICNLLIETGEEVERARERADELIYFVMDISCHTDYSLRERAKPYLEFDFHETQEVNALLGHMTAQELERMYDMENPYGGWVIEDEAQTAFMAERFSEENLGALKTWALCEVLYTWQDYMTQEFAFLEGYTGGITGAPQLLAAELISREMPGQLSELYAARYYTPQMDRQLQQMYRDIVDSYRELIQGADWLTKETRERLIRKLENMTFVYGAGKVRESAESDAELIGETIFDTIRRLRVRSIREKREKIGTPVDKEEAGIDSFIVNAKYDVCNSFTITVAIMKAPYFEETAPYAQNLGGLGMVIGHEIGHAFDSNCIDYDENGAYAPEGICEADRRELSKRLKQMEDYYSSFAIMDIYYVDGVKTSGENYADKGAMECLMHIVQTKEDRQKVFEGYARAFCQLMEDDSAISALDTDEHSPAPVRVNAVLSATDEFYECYDVQPADGMYIPPQKRAYRYR